VQQRTAGVRSRSATEITMPYLIRSAFVAVILALVWSTVWFQDDGITFFVPGVGGYHIAY
jgi:hypothetical protein